MGFWASKRVLVTGGASFIGSHVVERSRRSSGRSVRVADDLSSGRDRVPFGGCATSIEFMEGDLRDRRFADRAVADCEAVFHLAA